jgi:hypothetical protein
MHPVLYGYRERPWYQLDRYPKAGLDVAAMRMRKSMLKPETEPYQSN